MLPTWQYYLQNNSGQCYTVTDGTVTAVDEETPLEFTPEGWQDILIGYERNVPKGGNVRSFTFPLGFVRDGARILRHLVYSNSVEEKVFLVINKLELDTTDTTYQYTYQPFYRGEIDLSTLKDEEFKVSVSVVETGIQKALRANESTTYETPVDEHAERILVKMDGVYLREKHNWLLTDDDIPIGQVGYLLGTYFTVKEGQAAGFANASQMREYAPLDSFDFANSLNYFATITQDIAGIRLTGTLKLAIGTGRARIVVFNQDKTEKAVLVDATASGNYEVDATWDGVAGERYFLYYDAISITKLIVQESTVAIDFMSRYRTTFIPALLERTVLKELTGKVTGDTTAYKSDLLTSGEVLALTSVDAVRSIPKSKLKTSIGTFFTYCFAEHAAGYGVENGKIVVEPFSHFLKTSDPTSLGQAKDLKTSVATDLMARRVKVGYNTPAIDDVNGKYSFNNTLTFTSPLTTDKAKEAHEIISPYYADPYFIEIKRINLEGKTTTDDSADNDIVVLNVRPIAFTTAATATNIPLIGKVFIFPTQDHMEDFTPGAKFTLTGTGSNNRAFTVINYVPYNDGCMVSVKESVTDEVFSAGTFTLNVYTLNRKPYSEVLGLPEGVEASLFNIEYLTPKRMLNRHLTWLNSIYAGLQGQYLQYQTTEKNADLKTTYGSEVVDEDADVVIGTDRLFLPFYHEFDTRVPVNLPAVEEADPNTPFSTDWNEGTLSGIMVKAGIAPDTNKDQAWKLLSAPDNDLTQLIQG